MRYLGMSLGMGVALGYCAAFGTLLPPICKLFAPAIPVGETLLQIAATTAGQVTLLGVAACLAGIGITALAGLAKGREMPEVEKKKAIAEFDFRKGLLVATFSGVMSACFSFELTAGKPIGEASAAVGTSTLWTGQPKLVVVLLGGFTTNFLWCVMLNIRNRSGHEYFDARYRPHLPGTIPKKGSPIDVPGEEVVKHRPATSGDDTLRIPMLANYLFSALAGLTWYFHRTYVLKARVCC